MTRLRPEIYVDREQTYAKHFILESYLEKLAYKVSWYGAVSYIDGFAGPWQSKDERLEDTSPHIAVRVLRAVRDHLWQQRKTLEVRALFIEKGAEACQALEHSLAQVTDVEAAVRCGEFEDHIADAVAFANERPRGFCFSFIDPCSWSGYSLDAIAPLLAITPGEVLINFMTDWINRFIDDHRPQATATFEALFGSADFRSAWQGLHGIERQEAMVAKYCERVRERGRFDHVVSAIVPNPLKDKAHYHLVYATRHEDGLRTFRGIERDGLREQAEMRAKAQHRKRQRRTKQGELFEPAALATPYIEGLQCRYRARAMDTIAAMLASGDEVAFDQLAVAAMEIPMITEQDVRDLLMEDVKRKAVELIGLGARERKPKWGEGHYRVRRLT